MFRILIYTIFLPVFILVVSLFGFLYLKYPPESWKGQLIKQIEGKLKTKVEIESIHYGFDGFLKVRGFGLYITKNSSSLSERKKRSNQQPDLFIDELEILINPSSLWSQKLDIYSLYVHDLKARITQDKKRRYNWEELHLFKKLSKVTKKESTSPQAQKENLFQDRFSIKNIVLDNVVLNIQAPSLVPVSGKYTLNADITLDDNELELEAHVRTPKKSRVEIDSTFFMPARLPQLIRNYKKNKEKIARKEFPASKMSINLHRFHAEYVRKFLPQLDIVDYLDGKILLSTGSKKKRQDRLSVAFDNTRFTMNRAHKGVNISLNGKLMVYLRKTKIISKKITMKIAEKSFAKFNDLLIHTNKRRNKEFQLKAKFDLDIHDFKKYFDNNIQAEGRLMGDLSYGFPNEPLKANILLQDASFSRGHIPFLSKSNITIKLLDNQIKIPKTTLTVLKQKIDFEARGSVSKKKGTKLTYKLVAQTWDMNRVLLLTKNNLPVNAHAESVKDTENVEKNQPSKNTGSLKKRDEKNSLLYSFLPLTLRGGINFDSFLISKLNLTQFSAQTSFKKRVLRLDKLRFSLEKGIFRGNYQMSFLKKILHTFAFKIENLKLHKVFKKFSKHATIYATYFGKFTGQMEGRSFSEFSQTLDSKVQMKTSEGKMVNTFLQKGLLNGPLGRLESKLSHLEFLGCKAEILTREGNIYVESIKLVSNEFSFSIVGKFGWNFFGDAYMRLKFTDKFIENVASVVQLGIASNKQNDQYLFSFSCLQSNILEKKCWQPD